MNKKFVIAAAVLIYLITTYFSYEFFSSQEIGSKKAKVPVGQVGDIKDAEQADDEFAGLKRNKECPINGEMLTDKHEERWQTRRPLGVMIENHEESRPQSGISKSDVVYEFVAEGGISRFLVMYYCQDAKIIGPVRSARVYFISMLMGYGDYPLYAHVGGANTPGPADALGWIQDLGWGGYNDLNQFSVPFPIFARDYDRLPNVATEHTMYSSTEKLWEFATEKRELSNEDEDGESWDENFESWEFQDGKPVGEEDRVSNLSYDFWSGKTKYSVVWDYDAENNNYKRSHGDGEPHIDKNNDKQLTASNVVVILVRESSANDGYPGGHLLYKTVGKGEAVIFQNGEAIEGQWRKADDDERMKFYDGAGKELELVRGRVWVSAVPTDIEVDY